MEICDDFVDNDGDTLIDTDDIQDCAPSGGEVGAATGEEDGLGSESPGAAITAQAEICDDFDNDGDSFVDIEDPEGCSPAIEPEVGAIPEQSEQSVNNATALEVCDNSLDDDSDGLTDTDDLNDCPIGIEPMIEGNMTEET
jgi:hypothetical protein